MNDSLGTSFSYRGDVKIHIQNRNGMCNSPFYFHNNGTKVLFDAITRALCGKDISDEIPTYLDIYIYDSSGTTRLGSKLKHPLPFTGTVWGDSAGATAREGKLLFKTLITLSDIGYMTVSNSDKAQLVLLSKSGQVLCTVDTALNWLDEITASSDGLVVWTLTFSNEL